VERSQFAGVRHALIELVVSCNGKQALRWRSVGIEELKKAGISEGVEVYN
jgi:hypothetical protein